MNAKRDQNNVPTKLGTSNVGGMTPALIYVEAATNAIRMSNGSDNVLVGQLASSSTTAGFTFGLDTSITGLGQSFLGTGVTLGAVRFVGRKRGSPTGSVYAKIYAHSGTFGTSSRPTGAALATSDPVSVTTFSTTFSSFSPIFMFTGVNQITLTNGTPYVVTIEYTPTSGLDTIQPQNSGANTAPGNMSYLFSGSWSAESSWDLAYYVYDTTYTLASNSPRDENSVTTLMGVSSADGVTPIPILVDSNGAILIQTT